MPNKSKQVLKKKGGGVVIETNNQQLLEAKGKRQEGP